jgi:hypothetical protein
VPSARIVHAAVTAEEIEAGAGVLVAAVAVVVEAAAVVLVVAAEAVVVAAPAAVAAEAGTRNSLPQIFTDHTDNNEKDRRTCGPCRLCGTFCRTLSRAT